MASNGNRYNVGGVLLSRPFKIRRLGHFGFNAVKMAEAREFYGELLGFKHSDILRLRRRCRGRPRALSSATRAATSCATATDHHAFVLFNKRVLDHRPDRKFAPEVTINQITWQCGSLKEIMDAHTYFQEHGIPIQRVGRDMPGSNWHVYVYDPDGHTIELYYGIEQIGWNQLSKPHRDVLSRLPREAVAAPDLRDRRGGRGARQGHRRLLRQPHARGAGRDLRRRGRAAAAAVQDHQDRPGGLFVADVGARRGVLRRAPRLREERGDVYRGARCVFLRAGAEHHSVGLFPRELRRTLGPVRAHDAACRSASRSAATPSCARRSRS